MKTGKEIAEDGKEIGSMGDSDGESGLCVNNINLFKILFCIGAWLIQVYIYKHLFFFKFFFHFTSVQFSCSVMSDSLQPHGLEHARLPCPSPILGACSDQVS